LFVRSFVRSLVRSFVRSFVRSLVRSFVRSFVRSLVRSLARSFVRSFVRSLVRSFVRSFDRARLFHCSIGSFGNRGHPLTRAPAVAVGGAAVREADRAELAGRGGWLVGTTGGGALEAVRCIIRARSELK
jgi:hypothetical protein